MRIRLDFKCSTRSGANTSRAPCARLENQIRVSSMAKTRCRVIADQKVRLENFEDLYSRVGNDVERMLISFALYEDADSDADDIELLWERVLQRDHELRQNIERWLTDCFEKAGPGSRQRSGVEFILESARGQTVFDLEVV